MDFQRFSQQYTKNCVLGPLFRYIETHCLNYRFSYIHADYAEFERVCRRAKLDIAKRKYNKIMKLIGGFRGAPNWHVECFVPGRFCGPQDPSALVVLFASEENSYSQAGPHPQGFSRQQLPLHFLWREQTQATAVFQGIWRSEK